MSNTTGRQTPLANYYPKSTVKSMSVVLKHEAPDPTSSGEPSWERGGQRAVDGWEWSVEAVIAVVGGDVGNLGEVWLAAGTPVAYFFRDEPLRSAPV